MNVNSKFRRKNKMGREYVFISNRKEIVHEDVYYY